MADDEHEHEHETAEAPVKHTRDLKAQHFEKPMLKRVDKVEENVYSLIEDMKI